MLRTVARAGLLVPKRLGKLLVPKRLGKLLRPGVLSLLAAAGSSLRRGDVGRGLLLAGLALVSTAFKRLSFAVYGLLALNALRKRLQSAR